MRSLSPVNHTFAPRPSSLCVNNDANLSASSVHVVWNARFFSTGTLLHLQREVNNDNLCDCMPGFRAQFQVALGVPKESQAGGAHWRKMMKVVPQRHWQQFSELF